MNPRAPSRRSAAPRAHPRLASRSAARPKSARLRRVGRIALYGVIGFIIGSIVLVALYRALPPPGTPLMLIRRVEGRLGLYGNCHVRLLIKRPSISGRRLCQPSRPRKIGQARPREMGPANSAGKRLRADYRRRRLGASPPQHGAPRRIRRHPVHRPANRLPSARRTFATSSVVRLSVPLVIRNTRSALRWRAPSATTS